MTAREVTSHLDVPQTPTAPGHAASKKYVDDQIAGVLSGNVTMESIDGLIPALNAKMDKSLVDAKGDIVIGTADNTPGRLSVGTNGQVLKADSTKPEGLAWGALDKAAVGLSNVDNTSDADKPVSTAQLAALNLKQRGFVTGTVSTAAATAAKAVTIAGYTPTAGDWLLLTFTLGNSVASPTLSVNGGTAWPLRGGGDGSSANVQMVANQVIPFYFTGAIWTSPGPWYNNTYSTITNAELINTASTSSRLFSGQRAEELMVNEASKARTLTNKVISQSQITNLVSDLANKADALVTPGGDVLNKQHVQTHPESGYFSTILHTLNDLSYNNLRGGSTVYTLNGTPTVPGSMGPDAPFRNNVEFAGILVNNANDVVVIEVTLHKPFRYTNRIGIVMSAMRAARDVTMECYDQTNGVWLAPCYTTTNASAVDGIHMANANNTGANDVGKLRFTLTNFGAPGQTFCVTSLFLVNYASGLLTEGFLARDGGAIYGPITTPTNPATADALSRKGYVDAQVATREPTIAPGTTAQFWRGDKTWQTVPLDKAGVGLGNVDNTSDADKPVSTAQQTALNLKANLASPTFTGTVSGISKAMVGLSNVDNTADSAKPVSSAQQTALNGKENTIAVGTTAQYWRGDKSWQTLNKAAVGLSAVDNTSDANKPVSSATQTALNAKVDKSGTGSVLYGNDGAGTPGTINYNVGASEYTIAMRNTAGVLEVSDPTADEHAATKGYVDDTVSSAVAGVSVERTWAPEMVMNSGLIVDGYNDMPGGISVEPGPGAAGVNLDSAWVRIGDMTNNAGGDLVVSLYNGTATTQGTLITTITLPNGQNNQIGVLSTPYALAANTVVRASITKGGSTLTKPLHVQMRGRYAG